MNPVAITAVVIGSLFAYVVIGGVVWHVVQQRWQDEVAQALGSFFWPLIPFVLAALGLARLLAVRLPEWIIERSTRRKSNLPRAEVRR